MKLRKIFAAVVLFLSAGTAMAQQMPAIPVDKNVKIGRLDNGLTYYIRHNSYPEHVASFYRPFQGQLFAGLSAEHRCTVWP